MPFFESPVICFGGIQQFDSDNFRNVNGLMTINATFMMHTEHCLFKNIRSNQFPNYENPPFKNSIYKLNSHTYIFKKILPPKK